MGIKVEKNTAPSGKSVLVYSYDGYMRFTMEIVFPASMIPKAIGVTKIAALATNAAELGYAFSEYPGGAIGFEKIQLIDAKSTHENMYGLCDEIRSKFIQDFNLADESALNGAEMSWGYGSSDDALDSFLPTWARSTIDRASKNTYYVVMPCTLATKYGIEGFLKYVSTISGMPCEAASYSVINGADSHNLLRKMLVAWKAYEEDKLSNAVVKFTECSEYDAKKADGEIFGIEADSLVRSRVSNAAKLVNNEYSPEFKYAFYNGSNACFGAYYASGEVNMDEPKRYSIVVISKR